MKDHLFAVLRDVVFISNEIMESGRFDLKSSSSITNAVFHILRNARVLELQTRPNLVVCWGGHSIRRVEYDYTKKVGYELGLRGLDVCTGCGPGAMKGPMKGATIGHSKQRIVNGRYMGVTEPGIIAAEPPNPIVSQLVIMPDIEKRLEAFVRLGHGIVIFPGGAGTAEEILYLLGILLDPANSDMPFPVVFTGPADCEDYFRQIHEFIGATLGASAQSRYRIIMDDPAEVGAGHGAGPRGGPRLPAAPERLVRLQLAAQHTARVPASLRGDARIDAVAAPGQPSTGARARRQPAPRLLRHRGGQHQGIRHQRHRALRPLRARAASQRSWSRSMRCCAPSSPSDA